jgi:hypothetical protein
MALFYRFYKLSKMNYLLFQLYDSSPLALGCLALRWRCFLRYVLRRDELDLRRVRSNSVDSGTRSGSSVLGTDDLSQLVQLHSRQCLIRLRR